MMESGQNQVSVLVVEDDSDMAERWQKALGRNGCSVAVCRRPEEALGRAEEAYFDLAVLPEQLDGADSDELLMGLLDRFPRPWP